MGITLPHPQSFGLVLLFLCVNCFSCSEQKELISKDAFISRISQIIQENNTSYPQCNIFNARMCFMQMANSTMEAVMMRRQKDHCMMADRAAACIDYSLSACPKERMWPGLTVLHPFVNILKGIKSVVCSKGFQVSEEDDDKNCHMDTVAQCITGFAYVAADTSMAITCRQAKQTHRCLTISTQQCESSQIKNMVSMTTAVLSQMAKEACQKPICNIPVAQECSSGAKYILASPVASVQKSHVLCGSLKEMMGCIADNTMDCPINVYEKMGNFMIHLNTVVMETCANISDMMPMTDPYVGQIASFYAVTNSPFATKETVCPFYHGAVMKLLDMIKTGEGNAMDHWYTISMASHAARGICDDDDDDMCDDMEPMMEPMCDVQMAEQCVGDTDLLSLMSNVDILGWEVICHSGLRMVECVHKSMSGCDLGESRRTNATLHRLLSMVANYCPVEPVLSKVSCLLPKCDATAALEKCFKLPNETTLAMGMAPELVNNTLRCIRMHTMGCAMSPSFLPLSYTTKKYLDFMKPYVYTMDMMEKKEMEDPAMEQVTKCTYQFMGGFEYVMTNSNNFSEAMCYLFKGMDKECGKMVGDHIPSALRPGMKMQEMIMNGMMKAQCSTMKEKPGRCPKVTGDQVGVCVEKCSSDDKCPEHQKCCSNGCGHLCMDAVIDEESMKHLQSKIQEPASCKMYDVASYFSSYWLRLMQMAFTPITEKAHLCSSKYWFQEFGKTNMADCSPERKAILMESWKMIEAVHSHVCPVNMPMMMSKDEDKCQLEAAGKCHDDFLQVLLVSPAYHSKDTCMKLLDTFKCMQDAVGDCAENSLVMMEVKKAIPFLKAMIGNECREHFYGKKFCEHRRHATLKLFNNMQCDKSMAIYCIGEFDKARPILNNNPEVLCRGAMAAKMCVMANSNNCSMDEIIWNGENKTQIADNFMTFCPKMEDKMDHEDEDTKDMNDEDDDDDDDEEKCHLLEPVPECITTVAACFGNVTDICGNSDAIKSCMNLAMVGCDSMMLSSVLQGLQADDYLSSLACDFMPDYRPAGYQKPNDTFPLECMKNVTALKEYFKNPAMEDEHKMMCEYLPERAQCLEDKTMNMSMVARFIAHKVASGYRQLAFVRCETIENVLDDEEMMLNETATGYCDLDYAASCFMTSIDYNFYGVGMPLGDKKSMCKSRIDSFKCLQSVASGCSEVARARILFHVAATSSIMRTLGVCAEDNMYRCDPQGAMDCISKLGAGHVLASGTPMEQAICGAIAPVEKCVVEKSSACMPKVRMSIEKSLVQVSAMARSVCSEDPDMEEKKMKGTCKLEKASWCMNELLNKTSMLLQGQGQRKCVCSEIIKLSECAEMHSMNCPGEEGKMVEANKPLVKMLVEGACSREMEKPSHEMESCGMMAGTCLTQYLWLAMSSYTAMCSQAVPALACLRTAADICPSPANVGVAAAAKHLATVSMAMCGSKGCNPRMAYSCLAESEKYIRASGSRMLSSPMVCGGIMPSLMCAVNHTINCNHDDDPDLHKAIYALKVMVQDVCPKGQVNPVLGLLENVTAVEAILPVSMIFMNPMVSKETLCPQMRMAMGRFSEMMMYMTPAQLARAGVNSYMMEKIAGTYCHQEDMMKKQMEMNITRSQSCNVTMVMQCVKEADIASKLSTAVFYGMKPVCDAAEKVMCCLHKLTSGCNDYKEILISMQLGSDVASMVADQCPVQKILTDTMERCTPPPEMCYTQKALVECYVPLNTRSDVTKLCQNLTAVDMCFHKYLRGCMSIQVAPHANILKSYHAMCNSNPTSSLIRNDQLVNATQCAMATMDNLKSSFQTTNNPFKNMCNEIDKSEKCHRNAGEMPPMFSYMAMAGNRTVEEFKHKFCDNIGPDGVSVAEPYHCMEGVAAMCVTSYFMRIASWRFTPVGDREGACRGITEVEKCVKNALTSCSTDKQQMYREVLETIYFMHDRACPSMPYQHLLIYQDDVCYPNTAAMCVEGFGKYLAVSSGYNKVEACKYFGQMMQCVHFSTKNCTQTPGLQDNDQFVAMLNAASSIMGNSCPILSAVACDQANWRAIIGYAGCNNTAADKCLMDFGMELEHIKDNDTLMCSAYKKANDCVMIHTLLCENDSPKMEVLNHTLHVGMATYGARCVQKFGVSDKMKCWMKKPCTLWVDPCFPEEPEDTCRNVTKVEECLKKQEVGCSETFKLQRAEAIRNLLRTRNASCDVMSLMSTTPKYSPNMIGECYLMLMNLTGEYFMMESPTNMDIYSGVKTFMECVKVKSEALPDLWRGIWEQTMMQVQEVTKTPAKFLEVITMRIMEDAKNNRTDNPFLSIMNDDDMGSNSDRIQMRNNSRMNMNYTESEDCKTKEAAKCMMDYIAMTTFVGYLPFEDRPGNCWWKKNMLVPCINKHTQSCSARVQGKFIKMFVVTRRIENALGMCVDKNSDMETSRMEDNKGPMSKIMCKPKEAVKCMSMLSGALIGSVGKPTYTLICSSIMPVYRCVVENTWDCEPQHREAVENVWHDLYAVSMEMCRMGEYKMPEPLKCDAMNPKVKHMCDMPQALSCITSMQAKVMKGEGDICSGIPAFRSCMHKSLSGCEKTHVEAIEVMVAGLHKRLSQRCPRVLCDLCGARNCMAVMHMNRDNTTCFDVWKVKECISKHVSSCSEEEKHHVTMEMAKKIRNVSDVCKAKKALDMCALDFKDTVKKLFGLDIMLDWGMEEFEDDMMMPKNDSMKNNRTMTPPMSNNTRSNVSMEMVIKHLLTKNSQCPDLLKSDMKEALCKRAALSWRCVEQFVQTLPTQVRDVAMGTMKMVGMAVDNVCKEKSLTCYSCRGARSDEECNMMPQQQCSRRTHMCYTVVENGRISKGCAIDIPYTPMHECVSNGTKCVYKCQKDDCNMMKHKPIKDPASCNRKAAMKCGIYMMHTMVSSEMPDCRALMSGLMCMHDNTKDCISHVDGEISKMAANLFLTPMMMKCQAEPHYCSCGRCASVALGRVIYNPATNVKDICRMAEHTQKKVLEAVIADECTMGDLKDLSGSVEFAKTLLGDACDSEVAKMSPVKYNQNCNEEKAMMCFKSVNISWMVDHREKLGQQMVCRTVYKMMGCARVSMEKCDASVKSMELNMTAHRVIDMVRNMCNMSILQDFMSPGMDAERDERMYRAIGDEQEIMFAKIKVIHDVTRTGVRGESAVCKPSIAMNNCLSDLFMTPGTAANFCDIAKRAWDCQMVLVSQCTPLQLVPVMQAFYSLVAKDSKFCGYPLEPSQEQFKMLSHTPYYNMSRCIGEYLEIQAHAWVNPSPENLQKDCMYAIKMDNCVYHQSNLSPMAKIAQAKLAELTGNIKRAACSVMRLNMTGEKCGEEDMLCQMMKKMSMMNSTGMPPASDPPTCNKDLAGFCMTSYVSRILVSPFAPIDDHEYTCRDFNGLKTCLEAATPTCSEPTKQMFQMGYAWIESMVKPVCSMNFDLSQPSCKMAGQCLEIFGKYSRQPGLEQGEFCRKLDGTLECLEQHMFNCSASEMTYFRKTMYLLGNATNDWCPEQSQYICALSQLEARDVTKDCDTVGIGACIDNYYVKTYEMVNADPNYCSEVMTVTKCFVEKSKNCHPHVMEQLYQFMYPGLRSKDVNCTNVQAYVATVMPPCQIKKCNLPQLVYGVKEIAMNITRMREEGKTLNEVCGYVAGVTAEHANIMEGCNSLELYLVNFVLNKATNDYLMSCPANIYQARNPTPTDEVKAVTQCFSDLSTNMDAALTSPKYGFVDICEVTSTMTQCMGSAFRNAGMEPAIDWVVGQMNETHQAMVEFVKKECTANTSILAQITQAKPEPADCMQDTAVNCIKLMTVKAVAPRILMQNDKDMCSDVMKIHQCLEKSSMTCSASFKSQLRTMFVLNMALIGDRCKLNMTDMTPKDKAREMYMKLAMFMTSTVAKEHKMMAEMKDSMRADMMGSKGCMDKKMDEDNMYGDRDMDDMDRDDREGDMEKEDMEGDQDMEEDRTRGDMEGDDMRSGDMMMGRDMKCNLYRANQCMMKVVSSFEMYAPRICREDSTYLMDCIRPNLASCGNTTQMVVYHSFSEMEGLLRKSCATYMWMMKYLGQDNRDREMEDSQREKRNAFDMAQRRDREEMKKKMMEEVNNIFGQVNKMNQVLKFVRSADNPLDLASADSMEVIGMFKKIHHMSTDMKDCIETDSLEGQGYCHPSVALECTEAVQKELMSPWATKSRICLKYALAVRCGMLTSQGCDFFTKHHLHARFHEVMGYVGDMCPTVVKDECEVETKCKVKEVESCLMPLHSKIMASLQLPTSSTGNLCQYLMIAGECIRKKVEHCPEKVWYMLHNFLQPGMGPLARMCQKLPPQAMFTTVLWNLGSILTLEANMHKLGSMHTMLMMAKKHNMTMDMSAWMKPINMVSVPDEYLKTITNLHKMMDMSERKCSVEELMGKAKNMAMEERMDEMKNSSDKMTERKNSTEEMDRKSDMDDQMEKMSDMRVTGDSLMMDLLHMVKYVMMNEGLVERDEQFVKGVRIAMLNLDNDPTMKDLMDVSNYIMKEMTEKVGEERMKKMGISVNMVMNDVMKIIVGMGDGHEIVTSAYHTLAYVKIGQMMDQINTFLMKDEEKEYFNRWDYLNRGLVESMKDRMKGELTKAAMGYFDLHMKPNNTEMIEGLMQVMGVKKLTTCSSMVEVMHGAMAYLPILPQSKRALMNATLQALSHAVSAVCMGQKCYSCDGEKDNIECNRQTPEHCQPGQGCFTLIRNNTMIKKGCMYPLYGSTFGENVQFCSGNMCNKYKWSMMEEKDKECKPMTALMCLANLVPVIAADGKLDESLVYKNLDCIEKHASTCVMSETRQMGDIVPLIKHGLFESQCSADRRDYECGTRSIVGLALAAMNPSADRKGFCGQLNDTMITLEWAQKHNKCSEYEKLAAYKGIKAVMQTVGEGYCPMVMPKREVFCKNVTGTVCNKTAALQCFDRHMVMNKFKIGMSSNEKNVFCWMMTELMTCVGNQTSGCKPSDDMSSIHSMYKEKIGQAVSHCPHLQMHQDICHPELKTPTKCHPDLVYTQCMQPVMDKGCGMIDDDTVRDNMMKCFMDLTNGCSYMQLLSVWNTMDLSLVEYIVNCGQKNITHMLMERRADRLDHYFARTVAFVTARSMMIDLPEPTRETPITAMLNKLVVMRMNATGVLGNLTDVSSQGYRKVKMFLQTVADQRARRQDDTHAVARCAIQFDTAFTVALALPATFEGLYCETLNTFEHCLSKIDGEMVPTIYARGMRDQYARYRDLMCYEYSDHLVNISRVLMNVVGYNESMTTDKMLSNDQWNQLLTHIQEKDDVCDTWYISAMISNAATYFVSGPFKTQESYAVMCLIMGNLKETLKTKLDECSAEKRQKYHIIQVMQNENPICYDKALNLTMPATCQVEKAGECIASAIKFLSSKSLPDHQVCMHLSRAVTCVYHNTEHCSLGDQQYMNSMRHYIQSIMGNRCPLLTAMTECADPNAFVGAKCDVMAVKTCTESFTMTSPCGDIITISECVNKNSYNCSSYQLHQINGFMEMWWINSLQRCPEKDLVTETYSRGSCTPPPTCNLGEAYGCAAKYTSTDCSHMNSVKTCFEQHTRGCNNIIFMLGKATFELYHRTNYPSCPAVTLPLPTYAGDATEFDKMYQCMDTYVKMSPDLTPGASCQIFNNFIKCMGNNVTEKEAEWGKILAGPAFTLTVEMMERVCDVRMNDDDMEIIEKFDAYSRSRVNFTCDVSMGSQCLAMAGLHTMFSSVMTIEDKNTFCNRSATSMTNCVVPIGRCLRTNTALRSAHNIIDHIKLFSGVCAEKTYICAPEDAMYCGNEISAKVREMEMMANATVGRNMSMDMMTEKEQKAFCGMYEESMECIHRLTFDCSPEVGQYVKQSVMTAVCLTYDFSKRCPLIMETKPIDIPKCVDKGMDDREMTYWDNQTRDKTQDGAVDRTNNSTMETNKSNCSQTAIELCVSDLYMELYGAFLDCSRLHRKYVKTMNCIHDYSKNCMMRDPAVMPLAVSLRSFITEQVYYKCPNVVMKPCREPDNCRIEEAHGCYWRFTQINKTSSERREMCLAADIAKYCSLEHTKQCSIFAQSTYPPKMDSDLASRGMTCTNDAEECLYKFYMSSVSMLHRDLTMASVMKKREEMTYNMADMMNNMNVMMANITRMVSMDDGMMRDVFMNFSMLSHFMDNKTLEQMKVNVENLISAANSDDHMVTYAKVKIKTCAGFYEAWTCMMEKGSESGLSSVAVQGLNITLKQYFSLISSMCSEASVMHLTEQPDSCQILPAALTVMNHAMRLSLPTYGVDTFCLQNDLTAALNKMTEYTISCTGSVQEHLTKVMNAMKEARDYLCVAKPDCQATKAQDCVNNLLSNLDCSTYDQTHACVEASLQNCDAATSEPIRKELQTYYRSLSCETLPSIKVTSSPLRLLEGNTPTSLDITVDQDSSLWCPAGESCEIKFKLDIESGNEKCADGSSIPQIAVTEATGGCERKVTSQNWDQSVSFNLNARIDSRYDNTHNIPINVTAMKYVGGDLKLTRVVAHIQAVVVNTDQTAMCSTMGTNAMSTFDGLYQKVQYEGEFVVYKQKQFTQQEVHTLYQRCTPSSSRVCMCAVMVKVGGNSLTVDKCRRSGQASPPTVPNVAFYKSEDLADGLHMFLDNGGREIKVLLPTGTVVGINMMNLRLWIQPSSMDWLRTEGLCGSYDANKLNDAVTRDGSVMDLVNDAAPQQLGLSWRVLAFESLFGGVINGGQTTQAWTSYCSCLSGSTSDQCQTMGVVETCDLVSGTDITATFQQFGESTGSGKRKKRATTDPLSNLGLDYTYEVPESSWQGSWTETTARQECENTITNSDLGQKCTQATGYSFEAEVLACIDSIKENGNTLSIGPIVESMKEKCLAELDKNLQTSDPTIVTDILKLSCPNDCSGHGTCKTDGTCTCSNGYMSDDCSIQVGVQPTLVSLRDGDICELSQSNTCNSVLVLGQNFMESNQLSCYYEHQNQIVKGTARYITNMIVQCSALPAVSTKETIKIYVTNSGAPGPVSQSLGYTIYHPGCYSCSNYQTCQQLNTGCVISGTCYHGSASNPGNQCQRCIPELSTTAWTHVIGGNCEGYLSTAAPPTTPTPSGGSSQSPNTGNNNNNTDSSDDNRVILIILGVLTAGFALISILLACKLCVAKESLDKDSLTTNSNSLANSVTKYGNEDYTFLDPAKKRVDRPDQAFTPADYNQRAPIEERTLSSETNTSVTDVKDVSIAIEDSK